MPAAEHAVASWRIQLDVAAGWGVPAHITVLYPFVAPAKIDDSVLTTLRTAAAAVPSFDVVLTRVEWFERKVVWLAPEPAQPFRALTTAVAAAFPETPPYGGAYAEPVPHLTIGDGGAAPIMSAAAADVARHLPIRTSVESIHVICGSHAPDSWHVVAEIPLGVKGRA